MNSTEFTCKICSCRFNSRKSLSAHIHKHHNISAQEYYNKFFRKRNEGICPICGKQTPFLSVERGYQECCSSKCANNMPNKKEAISRALKSKTSEEKRQIYKKILKTLSKNHPDDPSCGQFGSKRHAQAMIDKYGDPYYSNHEKARKTLFEKTGYWCNLQFPDVKLKNSSPESRKRAVETGRQTSLKKWGVDNKMKLKGFALEQAQKKKDLWQEFAEKHSCIACSNVVDKYGQGWLQLKLPVTTYKGKNFINLKYIPQIDKYSRTLNKSSLEREVVEFMKTIYKGEIVTHCKNQIKNKKGNPCELDIYLPECNFAIECNGDYWHSIEVNEDKNYHKYKTTACREKGIELLHIFEFEWKNRQENMRSIIESCINRTYVNSIYQHGGIVIGDYSFPLFNCKEVIWTSPPLLIKDLKGEHYFYNCGYVIYRVKENK